VPWGSGGPPRLETNTRNYGQMVGHPEVEVFARDRKCPTDELPVNLPQPRNMSMSSTNDLGYLSPSMS
jgi:hypothetical protein